MNWFNGFLHHLLISLKLNFRNPQAIVMGYLVPIFFLLAFGTLLVRSEIGFPQTRLRSC